MDELLVVTSEKEKIAINLHTGSKLVTFKDPGCSARSCAVGPRNDIYSVNSGLLYRHKLGNGTSDFSTKFKDKFVLPEKFTAIAVSSNEIWLAGGSPTGTLYVWELASGDVILRVEGAHLQAITSLTFSQDEALLVTGSDDAKVCCWRLFDIINADHSSRPYKKTLTHHSLPVTDVFVGSGNINECRIYSVSEDKTLRIYDYANNELLTTFICEEEIEAVTVDPAERVVFLGLRSGAIQRVNLYDISKLTGMLEYVGGGGRLIDAPATFLSEHQSVVKVLAFSFDSSILITGDHSGNIFLWDVASGQVVRKFKEFSSAVTNLAVVQSFSGSPSPESIFIPRLKRAVDSSDNHSIWKKLPGMNEPLPYSEDPLSSFEDQLSRIGKTSGTIFISAGKSTNNSAKNDEDSTLLHSKIQKLEADLQIMKDNCATSEDMFNELWGMYKERVLDE